MAEGEKESSLPKKSKWNSKIKSDNSMGGRNWRKIKIKLKNNNRKTKH